jgi:pentose-5-phosphate-3-epimerase
MVAAALQVKSLRKSTNAFLDCHLCVLHPETYVKGEPAHAACPSRRST